MSASQYLFCLLARARPPAWAVAATVTLLVTPGVVHAQGSTAPEITSTGPFTVTEGETAVATLAADDSDTDAADLVWSKTGGADSDAFTLSSAGVLAFATAKDYEDPDDSDGDGSYQVTVQVSDGTDTDTADLVVTLANAIELTAITGPSEVTFAENGGGRVATFSASSDVDRDGVQWTISGNDADHFTIDSPPGALRFHIDPVSPNLFPSPPDFEDPDDADTSNDYSITLLALVGSEISSPFVVTVTVTDVDEAGSITLSTTKPRVGTALTATLTDPDGVTAGTTTWRWERNDGREGWLQIDDAASASYTPTAADGDRYLRVTATYTDDSFGAGKTVEATVPNVVIAHRLSSLTMTGLTAPSGDDRVFYPAFDPDTLHYAARCSDSMTMTLSAEHADTRVAVNGVQRQQGQAFSLSGLPRESDIEIRLSGAAGGSTTYVVHCIDHETFPILTTVKGTDAMEDLLIFSARRGPTKWLLLLDNNAVPRWRQSVDSQLGAYFQAFPDESHPRARYAYHRTREGLHGAVLVVLDKYFKVVGGDVSIKSPFNSTDAHDQEITPDGDIVLTAYSLHNRDLSFLQDAFPDLGMLGSNEQVRDSAIQIQRADGTVVFNWSSWDHMAIEDCISSQFAREYAHVNYTGLVDGDLIAGFRRCSKILRIDIDTGDVVWRAGPSILSREQWEAGETLQPDRGPAPLDFVNDPRGGFSGQHGGQMTADGNLLVYDNSDTCGVPPGVPADAKGLTECGSAGSRTRAVEYALDTANDELVFLREHVMPESDPPRGAGGPGGHAEPLENGDWLVSWSDTSRTLAQSPMPHSAVQVDPKTGTEKLTMTFRATDSTVPGNVRVLPISPLALAARNEALTASLPASESTSVFHTGATDSPQVVVAFSRPVVDFDETAPSLSVSGATVDSVSAHVVAGEPAHAYLVTLTPDGDGAITFTLVTGEACDDGGICAADGTTLSSVPAALVIGAPVTVSFGQAAYSVGEGSTRSLTVRLSSAHQGVRGVTVPIELDTSADASADDLIADEQSVTFAAGETSKTLTVEALDDDLVEGGESATLAFGTLPHGVTAGSIDTATITVTDADNAQFSSTLAQAQVAEGGAVVLTFAITNGVTFEDDQTVELGIGGSATPEDDFTLVDESNQRLTAPYELTFPSGVSSASVTIQAVDDSEIEQEAETITLAGTLASTGAAVGATQTLTISPSDVPDTPEVSIAAGSTVTEGEAAVFTLTRTASTSIPFSSPLTVSVAATELGSTLGAGLPTTARFEAGDVAIDVEVPTLDDSVVEPAGAVTLLILGSASNPPVYLTRDVNAATLAVNDNDVAAFTLSASAEEVAEGDAVTVTIAGAGVTFAEAQTLALALAGTATPGDDFSLAADGDELSDPYTVTLPARAALVAVTIETARDGEDDVGETIELTVSHNGNSIGAVTITIGAPPLQPVPVSIGGGGGGGGGGGPGGPTPSQADFEWTVKHDLEALDSDHDKPTGSWSDGATVWLLHNGDGADDAVYAYDLATGERVEDREFALAERNRAPRGVWSDGTTIWVSDSGRNKLFAHDLEPGERIEERDIDLAERNADARGIWSDGKTMWVLDERRNAVFAYDLESGALLAEYALDSSNGSPTGIWSDGVTLWVSDPGSSPRQLFAYRLPAREEAEAATEDASLERVRDEEFEKLSQASNNSPRGIWARGDVMYVADASDGKVYSYNMPDAIDARLASLSLSGIDIGAFDPDRTDYEGVIAEGVTETTVEAGAVQRRTEVAVTPHDADGDETNGHQVALDGVIEIAVTVTSADGRRERVYRVTFEPTVMELALGPTWTSFEWPGADGVAIDEAGLPEEAVAVYTWDETTRRWLGYFPGLEYVPGLNTLTGLAQGRTYWIAVEEPLTWTVIAAAVP